MAPCCARGGTEEVLLAMGGAAVRSEAEVGAFFQAIGGDAAWAPQVLRYLRHKDFAGARSHGGVAMVCARRF